MQGDYQHHGSGTYRLFFSNHLANTSSTHFPPCSKNNRTSSISTVGTTVGNSINKENLVDFRDGIDDSKQTLSKLLSELFNDTHVFDPCFLQL